MSKPLLFLLAAVSAYLLAGLNASIELSKALYRVDVRHKGSGNPGFTNFRRVFGWTHAGFVFALDFLKAYVPCAVFGWLFGKYYDLRQLGVAFTGVFALLGHAYPVWYHFRGGKSVLVGAAFIYLVDWRAGVVATAVFLILLLTTRYMSLASMCATATAAIAMPFLGVTPPVAVVLCFAAAAFVIARHHQNIRRLIDGTESKFRFHHNRENQ